MKFDSGADPAAAAALAKSSDVAIVFAYQWTSEGMDLPEPVAARQPGRADRSRGCGESAHHRRA